MDPLSIAASVAGLVSFTGAIIAKGYSTLSSVSEMKHLVPLLQETSKLSGVLAGVNARFSSLPPSSTEAWSDPATMTAELSGCNQTLDKINALITKIDEATTISLLIKRAAFDEEAKRLLSTLERHKSFFVLCLQLQSRHDVVLVLERVGVLVF